MPPGRSEDPQIALSDGRTCRRIGDPLPSKLPCQAIWKQGFPKTQRADDRQVDRK